MPGCASLVCLSHRFYQPTEKCADGESCTFGAKWRTPTALYILSENFAPTSVAVINPIPRPRYTSPPTPAPNPYVLLKKSAARRSQRMSRGCHAESKQAVRTRKCREHQIVNSCLKYHPSVDRRPGNSVAPRRTHHIRYFRRASGHDQ